MMNRGLTAVAGAWRPAAAVMAAAAMAFAPGAGHAQAPCPQTDVIRVMVSPSAFDNMTTYIAEEAGFFKKHCLEAKLVPVERTSIGFAHVLTGTLEFSDASVGDLLRARTKDLKLKIVVGESAGIPYSLVVRKGVAPPDGAAGYPAVMKRLPVKKIGFPRLAPLSQRLAATLLRRAGLDPAGAEYVPLGTAPEQLAALERGAVDAAMMADPVQDLAVAGGHGIVVDLRKPDAGPAEIQWLASTFQVKVGAESFLRERTDVARRYALANEEAARWIREPANFDEALKHVRARVKLPAEARDVERVLAEATRRYASVSSAAISRRSVQAWHAFEAAAGDFKMRVTFEDAVWSGAPVTE